MVEHSLPHCSNDDWSLSAWTRSEIRTARTCIPHYGVQYLTRSVAYAGQKYRDWMMRLCLLFPLTLGRSTAAAKVP